MKKKLKNKSIKAGDCVIFLWKNYCRVCSSKDPRIDGLSKENKRKGSIVEILPIGSRDFKIYGNKIGGYNLYETKIPTN